MQGTKLSLQEKKCKLYDEFDKFTFVKGETLYHLPPEWSKFVTDVKLARDLHTTNYDQLYSYLEKHEFLQMDSGLATPVFNQGDDSIAYLNKAMDFLIVVASSRVTVQQVQGRQGQSYVGNNYKGNGTSSGGNNTGGQARMVKCYNCQGEGHMARQCTQPKRPRNAAWFKEKAMLAKAQEAGQILNEEQLAFLADPDSDDVSNAKAVLMANLSSYGSDVLLEVLHSETSHNDMGNQSVHAMPDFKQTPIVDFSNNEITSDSNIISYSQYLQETQLAAVQDTNLYAQQDSMILSVIEQMSEQMINHVNN
ncbi:retrovirus-related pol polyprotein from transposon TNT 1-94 [Tanacetum coccineum]